MLKWFRQEFSAPTIDITYIIGLQGQSNVVLHTSVAKRNALKPFFKSWLGKVSKKKPLNL